MNENRFIPEWLQTAPYAPLFQVRDTLHKYGRYAPQSKTVTVADLIKFHGHLCGGLMEATVALRAAFNRLFPEGGIDRTDLEIVSSNSACGGDVAAYLTGARTRFNTHRIDNALAGGEFYVRRASTSEVVHVSLRDEAYPHEVKAQMRRVLSDDHMPADIDEFGRVQWEYARRLTTMPPEQAFQVEPAPDYVWPDVPCRDLGRRSDNDFKDNP